MKLIIGVILLCTVVTAFSATINWFIPGIESFDVNIYTTTDNDTYPVIIFLTGFGGLVPAAAYSNLLTKIADQKIIVIAVSKIENITAEYFEQKFAQFMINITDPTKGAKDLFEKNSLTTNVVPDLENQLAFLAQSAGCHVLTLYLTERCGTQYAQVRLLILMDPVDGSSPYDTHEADMFDDVARTAMNTVCATCSQLPMLTTCNFAQFRQDETNAIVNFTKGILSGVNGQQYLTFLQNPDPYFNSRATIKSNVQQITPSNGFCQSYS
ncbi:unnamed protein product [Rotaria sp. Silwood1]|nr:unnamed protein product [Rotaria sp. Silwood1]